MGGLRALTRVKQVRKFQPRSDGTEHELPQAPTVLKLVNLSPDQERGKDIKLSFKELPTSTKLLT